MTGGMISCRLDENRDERCSRMKEIRGHGFGCDFFFAWKGIKMDSVISSVQKKEISKFIQKSTIIGEFVK